MRLGRVVEERLVGIVEQRLVVGVADAPGEEVVVVGRQADQGQDLAGLRVHDDHHAALEADLAHGPFERRLGVLLLLGVDRQVQRVARDGLADRLEDLGSPSGRVALDVLAPVGPAQLGLVLGLEPGLAEEVVREVAERLELGQLIGRDGAGVAEDLREQRAVGVLPARLDGDLHAGQLETGLGDQPSGVLVDVARDPDEVEVGARVPVDRGVDLGDVHAEQGRQPLDDLWSLGLRKIGGPQLDREGRDIGHQRAAGPVVDQAARRLDRLQDGSIVRGERREPAAVDDLQVEQAGRSAHRRRGP